jgi:hypothetical protein
MIGRAQYIQRGDRLEAVEAIGSGDEKGNV